MVLIVRAVLPYSPELGKTIGQAGNATDSPPKQTNTSTNNTTTNIVASPNNNNSINNNTNSSSSTAAASPRSRSLPYTTPAPMEVAVRRRASSVSQPNDILLAYLKVPPGKYAITQGLAATTPAAARTGANGGLVGTTSAVYNSPQTMNNGGGGGGTKPPSPHTPTTASKYESGRFITFTRQHVELSDLEKLSQKAHAAAMSAGGRRRPTQATIVEGPTLTSSRFGSKKDGGAADGPSFPTEFKAFGNARNSSLSTASAFVAGPSPPSLTAAGRRSVGVESATAPLDCYTVEGVLVRDVAPPPPKATNTKGDGDGGKGGKKGSEKVGGGGGTLLGSSSTTTRRSNLLSMMAASQHSSSLLAAAGGGAASPAAGLLLTTSFVPAPTQVVESLLPLTSAVMASAVRRHNSTVIHRSTPGAYSIAADFVSDGGADGNAGGGVAGGAALRSRRVVAAPVGDAFAGSAKAAGSGPHPPHSSSSSIFPSSAQPNKGVSTLPTPSEHYFPFLVDAVLHSLTPATDRALQIVADEVAKEKQMARLRQGVAGAMLPDSLISLPTPAPPTSNPPPSATPRMGNATSPSAATPRIQLGANRRKSLAPTAEALSLEGLPTSGGAGFGLAGGGGGDAGYSPSSAVSPAATPRKGAEAGGDQGGPSSGQGSAHPLPMSPALSRVLRAASARRDIPSAPNSARRKTHSPSRRDGGGGLGATPALSIQTPRRSTHTHGATGGGGGLIGSTPRPPTAPTAVNGGSATNSARFSIYTSSANYPLPVREHGETLDALGVVKSKKRRAQQKKRRVASVAFAGDGGGEFGGGEVGFVESDKDANEEDYSESDEYESDGKGGLTRVKKGAGNGGSALKRTASLRRKSSMRALEDFEANRPEREGGADDGAVIAPAPLPSNGWSSEMTVFEFDGKRSYLQLPSVPDLENLIKSFSIDFWLLTDCTLEEDGRRTIFQISDQSAGRPEVGMQLHVGLNWYTDLGEGLRLYIRDASNRVCEVHIPFSNVSTGPNILSGNEPHHFRIDVKSLEEAYIHAFIDGEVVDNLKFLQTEHAATFNRWTGNLYVGGVPTAVEGSIGLQRQEVLHSLRGSIFELRFWRGDGNLHTPGSSINANATSGSYLGGNKEKAAGGGVGKHLTAADMALQEKIQLSEPWVRWPLVNPPPSLTNPDANGEGGGPYHVPMNELMSEAMRRVPKDHMEIRCDLKEVKRFTPRLCPVFDGSTTVVNMGTMSCLGDFLNHFEIEFVFKTTETKRCMSLMGFTDSQHKMCEMGVVLNAEPLATSAATNNATSINGSSSLGGGTSPQSASLAFPTTSASSSSPSSGGATASLLGPKERYRHHEHTITFYIVDCSGRCLSAFVRGSERNNVMDGRWHTLRIKVVDAEQGVVETRIDGLVRETIKVVRESPHTFLSLKDWVCVGGHNDRGNKVTNLFIGQMSYVNFIVRGEDFATLTFSEGPGSSVSLDQSGRRNHGLFTNPQTKRNKKNSMNWGLIFDSSSSSNNQHHSTTAGNASGGGLTSLSSNPIAGGVPLLDGLLYGSTPASNALAVASSVMHRNNTVSVAVVQFGASVADGRASEVAYDLIKNEPIAELEESYGSLSETDRGFGPWMAIPASAYTEVTNSQRMREIACYALRHSAVKAAMRHTIVSVRIGDAHISLLDVCGPLHHQGGGINFDRQLLKWVPHSVSTDGDVNKAMAVVNDQVSGLWRCLRELSAAPNIVLKLGPKNQQARPSSSGGGTSPISKTAEFEERIASSNALTKYSEFSSATRYKVTASQLLDALQDSGTRWRLALAAQFLIMNSYLQTSLHFVCSVSAYASASDVESIVCPQQALTESAKDRAAIFIQRVWRRKLAMLLTQRLSHMQKIRKQHIDEVINLRKTNPLVLAKKSLRALVITLHEYPLCSKFEEVETTACKEVVAGLTRQGYIIEHVRNPTKAQLGKVFSSLAPDSSHFIYIHGYGGYVRMRAPPPLFLHRLHLCMEEETARESISLDATLAFGHITKAKWEDLAAVKAVLAAAAPVKKGPGKKKATGGGIPASPVVAAAAAPNSPRQLAGISRAASPLNATLTSAASTIMSAATNRPSGLNTSPRRTPSVSSPRGGTAQQKRAQMNAALQAQQEAIVEEFRLMQEDLVISEEQQRLHSVWLAEEHTRVLLMQEFSRVVQHWQDFVERQAEAEQRQAQLARDTVSVRQKTTADFGLATGSVSFSSVLFNGATAKASGGVGLNKGVGPHSSSPTGGAAPTQQGPSSSSASPSAGSNPFSSEVSGWYVYPSDARRLEPMPSDLVSVDELISKALQRPSPPLGFQCVVAVDLLPPTPACHGGALLFSTTGHHFTFAYDGKACLSEYGEATKSTTSGTKGDKSAASAGARINPKGGPRKSFTSLGIAGGSAVANHGSAQSASPPHLHLANNKQPFGNTAHQQTNVLSWVLAKALNGHAPRIAAIAKESWYLQGSCDIPSGGTFSGYRDWKSFSSYVVTKVDLYARNDNTMKVRNEESEAARRRGGGGGGGLEATSSHSPAPAPTHHSIAAVSTVATGVTSSSFSPLSAAALSSTSSTAATTTENANRKPNRKRLSVILANAPPISPAVESMLSMDLPYTSDLVPLRTCPFDAEERESRRRDRTARRVTSFVKIGVEASRVVGDMQYEFRPLLKHLNVTDISMCPTVRILLTEGNKDIDGVDTEWIKAEATKLLASLNPNYELSIPSVQVLGSGIYIDVLHSRGDRTKTNQAVQFLASRSVALWGGIPLLPYFSINSEAVIDYAQVLFLVKCSGPERKFRRTLKDLFLSGGGYVGGAVPSPSSASSAAATAGLGMVIPRHISILKFGQNVE